MPFIKNVTIFARKVAPTQPLPNIEAGTAHSAVIKTNGRVFTWGSSNFAGQLGDNSTTGRPTPISILGAVKTFCKISVGANHTLAIDKNGRAWGWGYNQAGQLGDGTETSRLTPVSVAGAVKTFCQISVGNNGGANRTAAIDKNGRVWGWGNNSLGVIGDNTTTSRLTPVSVAGATKTFCKISTGNVHGLAIDKNGRAWGWGYNASGQLGDNSITQRNTPVSVAGAVKTFCEISAGQTSDGHSIALDKNGRAWAWGNNGFGKLGINSTTSTRTPLSVLGNIKTFCKISAGGNHTLAIDKNGRVWAWGYNLNGQLGDNSTTSRLTPVSVAGTVKTFCDISAGASHSLAIDKNGKGWSWGFSSELGDGQLTSLLSPVSVCGTVKTFCNIDSSNGVFTIILDKNGRVWGWGNNSTGQLGDNSTTSRPTPVSIAGTTKTFCKISAGGSHTMAIDKNGRAWGWGQNGGALGDNSTTQRNTPVSVLGAVKTFCQISTGRNHSVGLDKNGKVWTWGSNSNGQLGIATQGVGTQVSTPVAVSGTAKTFCQIVGSKVESMAIDKNGLVWGWGNNQFGQLGDNSATLRNTPVSVAGVRKTFCTITCGDDADHTLAIARNGRVWAWGYNLVGQLGIGSTLSVRTPISIGGTAKTFCKIAVGQLHSAAIDKNGRAWTWGYNLNGQLGDNSTTSRLTPVSVAGAVKTFCAISAGSNYTIAIDKNGRSWGWGRADQKQLGNNYGDRLTPVAICNI